jgi:ribose transport system permease protein
MSATATSPTAMRLPPWMTDRAFVIISRLAALIILVVVLSLISPHFLSLNNLTNVFRQAAVQFVMAAGLTLVVLAGGIDLSVGAVLGLSACLAASLINGGDVALGVFVALSVGLGCGLVNGALVTLVRIPSFMATYGMLWIAQGLAVMYMKGDTVYGLTPGFRSISTGFFLGIPLPVWIGLALMLLLHGLLHTTVLGRSIYAIGGNPAAARLSGMPVRFRLIAVYGLSGLLSGFAALIVIARINSADSSLGEELLLPAIAAVCLGGTSLFGGVGGIVGTAVGSLILAIILNGLNLLGVQTYWQAAVTGGIILLSVLADQIGGARLNRQS